MAWPSILSALTDPLPTQRLNSPSHSSIESAQNTAIEEVQNYLGTQNSVAGTLIYDIKAPGSDGGGHIQSAVKGGTGLTSFTKGDIIVAQNPTTLAKLSVSPTNGYALISDSTQSTGINWGIPNNKPTIRVYDAPSTIGWARPSNLSYVAITMVSGGGGGGPFNGNNDGATGGTTCFGSILIATGGTGGARGNSGGANNSGGGGGGSGIFVQQVIPASSLLGSLMMVIGAGGAGGTDSGAGTGTGAGGLGGTLSGTYTTGAFSIAGAGYPGGPATTISGGGGSNPLGKGGPGREVAAFAWTGTGYGAGGGGASVDGSAGAAGNPGIIIIYEY